MTTKFTKREILEALANGITTDFGEITAADIRAFAENEIALLDKRAASAKKRAAAKKEEPDELLDAVASVLSTEFEPIADIFARIEGPDLTAAKVSAKLRKLVDLGRAEKTELKIKPTDCGKTKALVGYRAI